MTTSTTKYIIGSLALLGCGDDTTGAADSGASSGVVATATAGDETTGGETTGGETTRVETAGADSTGVDSTGVGSTGADSTGPGMACGNGVVEPGEDCDDDNEQVDDACYPDCSLPYEVPWTATHDSSPIEEAAWTAVFDAAGNLYVRGVHFVGPNDAVVWLRQYLPDGSEGWTWTYESLTGASPGSLVALAPHPSGDLIVVGDDQNTGHDLVMRVDVSSQSIVWSDVIDLMGVTEHVAAVTVDTDGIIFVSGRTAPAPGMGTAWLRRYDADGGLAWNVYDESPMSWQVPIAVLADGPGEIYHVGNFVSAGPEPHVGWVRKLDTSGNELWRYTLDGVGLDDADLDGEGNLVLSGDAHDVGGSLWIGKFDPDFNEIVATSLDVAANDMVVGAGGSLYLAGSITGPVVQSQIWAARYSSDVSLRWWSHSDGNDLANDHAIGIAVSDDESRVAIVGRETTDEDEGPNSWVRMLHNNPTPRL
ncbi:MAG: hypothetical protein K0V04_00475 [Deltaproteobacteria bacterium]|nr:hypothetical protein [Deltaproteobacteria bacterium]